MLVRKNLNGLLLGMGVSVLLSVSVTAAPIYVNEEFGYHGYETYLKEDVPLVELNDILTILDSRRQAVIPSLNDIIEQQVIEKTNDNSAELPILDSTVQNNDVYSDYKANQGVDSGNVKVPVGVKDKETEEAVNKRFREEASAAIKSGKLKLKDVAIGNSAARTVDCTKQYMDLIVEFVDKTNKQSDVKISVAMVQTIITIESGGNTAANGTGANGLMQIQANPHRKSFVDFCETEFGPKKGGGSYTTNDLYNPYYNIAYGVKVLHDAIKYCQKYGYCQYTSSVCAYNFGNGGLNTVMKNSKTSSEWDWLLCRGIVAGTETHLDKFINHFPG